MRTGLGRAAGLAALGLGLGACTATRWEAPPPAPAPDAATGVPRSTRGNPPFYEVFGRRYYVMRSNAGYRERGVASWYGTKFHGRQTSSGEIYDMHAMTAAHKTLPLPTRVRVTNLRNGRSVVVVVNDRGPFVDNRIIDLSYAAATTLDMVRDGTALVEVEALPDGDAPVLAAADAGPGPRARFPAPVAGAAAAPTPAGPAPAPAEVQPASPPVLLLQVGAFGDPDNAERLRSRIAAAGIGKVFVERDDSGAVPLFRVRLGPIDDVGEYDALVQGMAALEIRETHLVTARLGGS